MIHTRQVLDWCRDNQYYQQYLNFNEYDFVKGQLEKYGYRSIPSNSWSRTVNTYVGNEIYSRAHCELEHRFPHATASITGIAEICPYTGLEVRWHLRFSRGRYSVSISYAGYELNDCVYRRTYRYMWFTKSSDGIEQPTSRVYSGWLDEESISSFVRDWVLREFFYGPGAYTVLMIQNHWTKDELKNRMRLREEPRPAFNDMDVRKAIRRRYRIESELLRLPMLIEACKKLGRQKVLTELRRFDMTALYESDADVSELETEFYEEIRNQSCSEKRVVLI